MYFIFLKVSKIRAIQLHDQNQTIPTFVLILAAWMCLTTPQWDSVAVGIMSAENLYEGL